MENNQSKILEGLNDEQRRAVECTGGPELIVAGAGSGKTRVLTSRIAYIMSKGVDPSRILALTFTRKAASEMKERIAMMVGGRSARFLVMGTFHSVFVRFLRDYASEIGYPAQFTIYDQGDSISAIKACVKQLELDDKVYKPREVLSRISMAKNNLVTWQSYKANTAALTTDAHSKRPRICDIYELYATKCKQSGVMDFDDILLNMNILLRDCPRALEEISARFDYILVDEYQDTNFSQYLILKKLAQKHRNICVVGDDSQSIYAFRGAKVENILNFKKDYPDCATMRLERNYRSTRTIVCAANSLIAHNEERIPKECYSVGEEGGPISVRKTWSEGEEAATVVSEILGIMRGRAAQYQDFAILYRTNSQLRALEDQLRRRNIPYMIYSGNSFFERAEVKDMMAYFKLVVNVNDDESFKRIVNKPARAIGDTSVSMLNEVARAHGCSLFRAAYLEDHAEFGLKPAASARIRQFCDMVGSLASRVKDTGAYELAAEVADKSGLLASFRADTSIEGMSRTANVEELLNSVQAFVEERINEMDEPDADALFTIDDFLENTALLSNVDVPEDEDTNNKVALMTVHSSKGLEFPYVFVTGMEENLFPSGGLLISPQDLQEERRLFYVALTRAKSRVILTYATDRMRNGRHESNSPSRFLKEIDPRYLEGMPEDDDMDSPVMPRSRFGGGFFGRQSGGDTSGGRPGFGSTYGRSSAVTYEHRRPASNGTRFPAGGSAPNGKDAPVRRDIPASANRPGTAKPAVIDPGFVPVDMRRIHEGERVEHNRFGGGLVKEIRGEYPELKAVIVFDDYGEKLLLLKYAKLRPEKTADK